MSWTPLKPVNKGRVAPIFAGVSLGLSRPGGRYAQWLRIVFRPDHIDHPPAWLKPGKKVSIMLGAADHAGLVRMVPDGDFTLTTAGGVSRKSNLVCIKLPPPEACHGGKIQPSQMVEYDHADGWIEITLPKWCLPAPELIASLQAAVGFNHVDEAKEYHLAREAFRCGAKELVKAEPKVSIRQVAAMLPASGATPTGRKLAGGPFAVAPSLRPGRAEA